MDRYLFRELLVPLAYCLGGFLLFYVAFDLIFGIGKFQDAHLHFTDVVDYYVVTLPELLVEPVIPVALLLALLHALTNHSRHNELTAMRAAGVGTWRLAVPYLSVAVFLGLVVFALNELVVPRSAEEAKTILSRRQTSPANRDWTTKLDFNNATEQREWNIPRYNRVTSEMILPVVRWETPDGTHREIYAQRAVYSNGKWTFYNVEEWVKAKTNEFKERVATNSTLTLAFPETPAWINSEIKVAASMARPEEAARRPQLSIREILDYLRLHPHQEPRQQAMLMTLLQEREAEPFTCLAVVLIALPFGARSGRRNVFAGVASAIFICFAYFITQRFCSGLGIGGELPPAVAAWLPNLVFGLTGLFFFQKAR